MMTWDKWKPVDLRYRRYLIGNFRTFGFWSGMKANITLMSPLMNMLLNWKYRNARLSVWLDDEAAP